MRDLDPDLDQAYDLEVDALPVVAAEQVHVARLRGEVQDRALLRGLAPVDPRDDRAALAADLGAAVDVRVGAELLDDIDLDGQARALVDDVEVLGAHPEVDRPVGAQRRPSPARGTCTFAAPKWTRSPSRVVCTRFMAGEPMKPATNTLLGLSYMCRGVSHCWRMPSLSTATRSPIVMASTWSWVT